MINYQKETDKIIQSLNGRKKLLLHACCAPCSSYVIEYLKNYFDITVLFYNPNIFPTTEYDLRLQEEIKLAKHFKVDYIEGEYCPQDFFNTVKGYEMEKEGGERCLKCFRLRLAFTAKKAKELGFDYFTTSLTISPLKNAQILNELGIEIGEQEGVRFLASDFKKKGGYARSVELTKELGFYRQNYCGCIYSKRTE